MTNPAQSTKMRTRGTRIARSQAGQVIDFVLETHGALDAGVTLHESPAGLIRDWARFKGIAASDLNITNMSQALKRHPRYVLLEGGTGRRPTFKLLPQKDRIKLVPPIEDTPVPDPVNPGMDLEEAIENLKDRIAANVEARVQGEHEAQLTLVKEALDNVTRTLGDAMKAVADVRDLL